jgi:5'-deoxynucleotidase YfbR-like HD superfamily hydrolase
MIKVFLSHSSHDKNTVERLAKDLRKDGINVWLDAWEIAVGESILQKVQEGLQNAQFVALWLTDNAIKSGWVTKEWHTTMYQEIAKKSVIILPLLADDCEIPLFLADKKYADFRTSYRDGLKSLLAALRRKPTESPSLTQIDMSRSVTHYTNGFLTDLAEAVVPIPTLGNLKLLAALKALPRSGKLLRLEGFVPEIPIRSIFDHIMSVAHSADCLVSEMDSQISDRERVEVARCIAYHDLCEVVLGDIPQYTKLNRSKRNRARVGAEIRLSQLPAGEPERITNEFIAMFLHESERGSLKSVMDTLKGKSPVKKFFLVLDKLDPIIAVWRYLDVFRGKLDSTIDEFLLRLRHFFENPTVKDVVRQNSCDVRLLELTDQLQNSVKARRYYSHQEMLPEELFALPETTILKLIQGRRFEFATSKHRTKHGRRSNVTDTRKPSDET